MEPPPLIYTVVSTAIPSLSNLLPLFSIVESRNKKRLLITKKKLLVEKNKYIYIDFVDCAEHLVNERVTCPERLAVCGRSAGGLLIGNVVNMRPDLFAAAVADVPFVDLMNTVIK